MLRSDAACVEPVRRSRDHRGVESPYSAMRHRGYLAVGRGVFVAQFLGIEEAHRAIPTVAWNHFALVLTGCQHDRGAPTRKTGPCLTAPIVGPKRLF